MFDNYASREHPGQLMTVHQIDRACQTLPTEINAVVLQPQLLSVSVRYTVDRFSGLRETCEEGSMHKAVTR